MWEKGFLLPKGLPQVAGVEGLPQPPFLRQKALVCVGSPHSYPQ